MKIESVEVGISYDLMATMLLYRITRITLYCAVEYQDNLHFGKFLLILEKSFIRLGYIP